MYVVVVLNWTLLLGSCKILCLEVEKSGMYEASIVVKVLYIDGNN